MNKVVITKQKDLTVAIEYDGNLKPLKIFPTKVSGVTLGSVYVGRISNIKKDLGAVFVDFTPELTGFLPIGELPVNMKQGDMLPVRVVKEPVKTKGYTLSTVIEIAGEYCVVSAGSNDIGFSKKLAKDVCKDIRKAIEDEPQLKGAYGAVIRTNAGEAGADAVIKEYIRLNDTLKHIENYKGTRTLYSCLYTETPAYVKALSDLKEGSFDEVICEDEEIYEQIKAVFPGKARLHDDSRISLSALYAVKHVFETATCKKVNLKSGGYLVIEPTEALTVIDVNSGKYTGRKDKNDMIRLINREAAEEAVFQIKLRNISGMILIDFINFEDPKDEQDLAEYVKQLFKDDNSRVKVYGFTNLKLMEISRQKIRASIYDFMC